jgi:hypothetical protein
VHPDPDRLFEQAETLINSHQDETDLRRSISTAYYGIFHFILRYVADTITGPGNRSTELYNLVYRSVEHKSLKTLCDQFRGSTLSKQVKPYEPVGGFGPIIEFSRLTATLYEQRIWADYNPMHSFNLSGTRVAVSDAREAVKYFKAATAEQRGGFLALLLIKPRSG